MISMLCYEYDWHIPYCYIGLYRCIYIYNKFTYTWYIIIYYRGMPTGDAREYWRFFWWSCWFMTLLKEAAPKFLQWHMVLLAMPHCLGCISCVFVVWNVFWSACERLTIPSISQKKSFAFPLKFPPTQSTSGEELQNSWKFQTLFDGYFGDSKSSKTGRTWGWINTVTGCRASGTGRNIPSRPTSLHGINASTIRLHVKVE